MKVITKEPGRDAKLSEVPDLAAFTMLNNYLEKKNLPKLSPEELAEMKKEAAFLKDENGVFTLFEMETKDGKIIKIAI